MRKAHREAARLLYEQRNRDSPCSPEVYVDLHGLHPEEAVEYLEQALIEQQNSTLPVYAITGTGHHSKNGKDKVGRAIRTWLGEWRYAYREFSVSGDGMGGVLGIDPKSFDRSLLKEEKTVDKAGDEVVGGAGGSSSSSSKVKVLKEVPKTEGSDG